MIVKVNNINSHNSFPLCYKSVPLYRRRLNNQRKNILPGESGKFSSKELDPETGLYCYGARYLDPKTSRWISGDPAIMIVVGIDVVPGMVSPKLNPHWNNTTRRFYNLSNGQFVKTMSAKVVNIAKAAAGLAIGLLSRKDSNK